MSRAGWRSVTSATRRPTVVGLIATGTIAAMLLATGCGSDDANDPPASVSTDAILTALVDWAVESDAPPTTADEEPPVVYIAAASGDTIDAAVQASVVASTADDATVRFADGRNEAIDDSTDELLVHDDGVLLVVGELPDNATMPDVSVERYRSLDDASVFIVTFAPSGEGARVTGATQE